MAHRSRLACVDLRQEPVPRAGGIWWPPLRDRTASAEVRVRFALDLLDADRWRCQPRCIVADVADATLALRVAGEEHVEAFVGSFDPLELAPERFLAADGSIRPVLLSEARVAAMVEAESRTSTVGHALCPACPAPPFDLGSGTVDSTLWERWVAGSPIESVRAMAAPPALVLSTAPEAPAHDTALDRLSELARGRGAEVEILHGGEEFNFSALANRLTSRCSAE